MTKPLIKLGYEDKPLAADSRYFERSDLVPFQQIKGKIRRLTATPTWTPRADHLEEQFAIIYNAGTAEIQLAIYDFEFAAWMYIKMSATPF